MFHSASTAKGAPRAIGRGTFIVRTSASNPLALASVLRREVPRARPGFRVSNIRTQTEINEQHTVRERLLAMLALFFAVVALLLAGIGLYGVLDYSVLQRRREIGIRMAIGAQASDIARRVTTDALAVVLAGSIFGIGLGNCIGTIHRVAALRRQGHRCRRACTSDGDNSRGGIAGRAAGGDPGGSDRSGYHAAIGIVEIVAEADPRRRPAGNWQSFLLLSYMTHGISY